MSITYSFVDSVLYGTEDINNITKRLCGAGIAPFPSKDTYNVSDLNGLTAAVTEQGVSLDGCICTSRTENGENIINVGQGVVFFENGAALEVDAEGFEVRCPIGSSGYIYAYFSTALQTGEIRFSELLPGDGLDIPIARVRPDNTISDCRSFAGSKVATMGKNAVLNIEMERVAEPYLHNDKYVIQKLSGVNVSRFSYAAVASGNEKCYFPVIEDWGYTAIFGLEDNEIKQNLYYNGEDLYKHSTSFFYKSTSDFTAGTYYLEVVGTELCLLCSCEKHRLEYVRDDSPICCVCLM